MAVNVNTSGKSHCSSLVSSGKYDATTGWSFSAEDGNKLLGPNGSNWTAYSQVHLAVDTSQPEKTKARYKYPVAKGGKVYRSGCIAAKQRAAQQGESDIESAVDDILQAINKKEDAALVSVAIAVGQAS